MDRRQTGHLVSECVDIADGVSDRTAGQYLEFLEHATMAVDFGRPFRRLWSGLCTVRSSHSRAPDVHGSMIVSHYSCPLPKPPV